MTGSMSSAWYFWVNIATTAKSLRIAKPRMTVMWLFTFPFQAVLGLAYLVWIWLHAEVVFT